MAASFLNAIKAFKARRAEQIQTAFIEANKHKIFVSVEDSEASGNCQTGTRIFRETVEKLIGANGKIGAVRASALLEIRDDSYTRRAVNYAAIKYQK